MPVTRTKRKNRQEEGQEEGQKEEQEVQQLTASVLHSYLMAYVEVSCYDLNQRQLQPLVFVGDQLPFTALRGWFRGLLLDLRLVEEGDDPQHGDRRLVGAGPEAAGLGAVFGNPAGHSK